MKFFAVKFLLAFCFFLNFTNCFGETSETQKRVHGVFRINTDISAGEKSLFEIAQKAVDANVDFIVVSDQFLVRCEYGLLPFRNVFKVSRERKSVATYGIKKYLELIERIDREEKRVVIISGLDVAPHYFWEKRSDGLYCRQFSQQLTLFGDLDEQFVKGLPVIHNFGIESRMKGFLLKLAPLLLIIPGLLFMRRRRFYDDAQGNKYFLPRKKINVFTGFAIFATAILWTLNNRPHLVERGYDQYKNHGSKPYQNLIDYVNSAGKGKVAVVWSSPEAKSLFEIEGVKLRTEKYANVIYETYGHNGFAAIYGDARTAHLAGREWDKALIDYCEDRRQSPPFAYGELDYHRDYPGVPFDYIKTVVLLEQDEPINKKTIFSALVCGASYAVSKGAGGEIKLEQFSVLCGEEEARTGETIFCGKGDLVVAKIAGEIEGENTGQIQIILNGEPFYTQELQGKFFIEKEFPDEKLLRHGFVRFIIQSSSCGELVSNPIFIKRTP